MISEKLTIGTNVEIHPLALIEDGVFIGDNTKIGPFCIVRKGAKIGANPQRGGEAPKESYAIPLPISRFTKQVRCNSQTKN